MAEKRNYIGLEPSWFTRSEAGSIITFCPRCKTEIVSFEMVTASETRAGRYSAAKAIECPSCHLYLMLSGKYTADAPEPWSLSTSPEAGSFDLEKVQRDAYNEAREGERERRRWVTRCRVAFDTRMPAERKRVRQHIEKWIDAWADERDIYGPPLEHYRQIAVASAFYTERLDVEDMKKALRGEDSARDKIAPPIRTVKDVYSKLPQIMARAVRDTSSLGDPVAATDQALRRLCRRDGA